MKISALIPKSLETPSQVNGVTSWTQIAEKTLESLSSSPAMLLHSTPNGFKTTETGGALGATNLTG